MPIVPGPGAEFADFGDRDLLFGLTSEEAWVNLTENDLQVSGICGNYPGKKHAKKYINYTLFVFNPPFLLKTSSQITMPYFITVKRNEEIRVILIIPRSFCF